MLSHTWELFVFVHTNRRVALMITRHFLPLFC
jgi:hypothetical protein